MNFTYHPVNADDTDGHLRLKFPVHSTQRFDNYWLNDGNNFGNGPPSQRSANAFR